MATTSMVQPKFLTNADELGVVAVGFSGGQVSYPSIISLQMNGLHGSKPQGGNGASFVLSSSSFSSWGQAPKPPASLRSSVNFERATEVEEDGLQRIGPQSARGALLVNGRAQDGME